jgi:restriction system protein
MVQVSFDAPRPPVTFVGRDEDLAWLREEMPERFGYRDDDDLAITGEAGIGKTALIAEHLQRNAGVMPSVWIDCASWESSSPDFRTIFDNHERLIARRRRDSFRGLTVVLDGADRLDRRQLSALYFGCRNRKTVSQVIVTSRTSPVLRIRKNRELRRLSEHETKLLMRNNVALGNLDEPEILRLIATVNGHPDAAMILAGMAKSLSSEQLRRVLSGEIYNVADVWRNMSAIQVGRIVKPLIVADNERIIKDLKTRPDGLYQLSPRQFEEIIADLLQDMDYEVTLTQQTRDGGKDILAAKKTEVGDVLCLVDAKRYKKSHKIGVSMVRTLLGTLADYQATSAMLATTSTYSRDAHAMQEKHKYKLSLKDFADVVEWIQKFGKN